MNEDITGGGNKRLSGIVLKEKERESLSEDTDRPPPPPAKSPLRSAWEPKRIEPKRESEYVFNEPGALYFMNQEDRLRVQPAASSGKEEDDFDEDEFEDHSMLTNPRSVNSSMQPETTSPDSGTQSRQSSVPNLPPSPVTRRQTPMGFEVVSGSVGVGPNERPGSRERERDRNMHLPVQEPNLGRRPSGARAQPVPRVTGKRFVPSDNTPSTMPYDLDEQPYPQRPSMSEQKRPAPPADVDDHTVDALAALSFLEQEDVPADAPLRSPATSPKSEKQKAPTSALQPPQIFEPEVRAPSPPGASGQQQYRSTFAPSKQAAERKARSQAQQAAHDAAVHKPGRPNGRQKVKQREGGWESSEEEDEEEEDEDEEDDVNTDDERPATGPRMNSGSLPPIAAPVGRNLAQQQQMSQQIRGLSSSTSGSMQDVRDQQYGQQQRPMRTLPQIPRGRSPGGKSRLFPSSVCGC